MSNRMSPYWRDGRQFPTAAQFDRAMDDYDRLSAQLGDDPNAIADRMGWTRGTGYAAIARNRLSRDGGLFAEVA